MHTYKKSEPGLWTVGYYTVESESDESAGHFSKWHPLSDHNTELSAMRRVNYLNGGGESIVP